MADDEKTVADEATDETLSKAWGDVKDEEKVETKEEVKGEVKKDETITKPDEKKPPEKASAEPKDDEEGLDHKESSKLGRKLKGLYDKVDSLTNELEALRKPPKTEPEIEVPEVISTPEDIDKYLAARSEKLQRDQKEYEKNYLGQVNQFKATEEDETFYDEVVAEITRDGSPFNRRFKGGSAFSDARVNYAEAKAFLISKKMSGKKKVPDRETADAPPIQPAASATRTTAKTVSLPHLDAEATAYVGYLRRQGMTDEDIAKELS